MSHAHELTPRVRDEHLEIRAALGRCAIVGCGGERRWGCPECGVFYCANHTPPLALRMGATCISCGADMEIQR